MRVRSLAGIAAIVALAACSDNAVQSTQPSEIKAINGRISHIQGSGLAPHTIAPLSLNLPIQLGPDGANLAAIASRKDANTNAAGQLNIEYWGGNVINKQKIALIYYAPTAIYANGPRPGTSGDGERDHSLIGHFLNNVGNTPYWNINSTYYDEIGHKEQTFIRNWMQYQSFWAANENAPSPGDVVTPDDMVFLIETGFANRSLKYDPNTLYMIMTGPGVNLGGGFSSNNLSYCAFHSGYWFDDAGPIVQFAAMPYDADFNPDHPSKGRFICTFLTKGPNDDLGADATVSGMIHETEENATDPVGLTSPPYFAGWYDEQGEENGDKCAYIYGPTLAHNELDYWNIRIGGKPFLVQQNWSNVEPQGCLTGLGGKGKKNDDNGGPNDGGRDSK